MDDLHSSLPEEFVDVTSVAQVMQDFPHLWFVSGGWAIDLYVERLTRPHKDVDLAIWRRDQRALHTYLTGSGWKLEKACEGLLEPWMEDEFVELPVHTIWCKNANAQPDFFEVLFNEADSRQFFFRRNIAITQPVREAIIQLASGLRILAPEIVLLYKANNHLLEGNRSDFEIVLPFLNSERRTWLREALDEVYPGHSWFSRL